MEDFKNLEQWPPKGINWYYSDKYTAIAHGDCLELLPQMPKVDLVLTDPQYLLANGKKATTMNATANRGKKYLKGTVTVPKDWGFLVGDDEPFNPNPFLGISTEVILWGAIHFSSKLPNSTSWLVWDKRGRVASDDNADCEMAWSNLGGPARVHTQLWKGICRAGEENIGRQGDKFHPFQKPIRLMRWCIGLSKTERTILDPFGGSCTTAVAAKQLNRKCIIIEIEEKYCEIGAKRLSQEVLNFSETHKKEETK